ncbi:uncharacterized protein LOC141773958 isoform X1 [Sebastes fasciatus]|uniref:uncharacterized protein LOC141773958 isoform X1 n=1 Tax=Sebastes fasciatus TaxID=394691 RepID=UPI003D9EB28E
MPDFCSAFGCSNERNAKTKEQGITFHRFPKDKAKRQSWTLAMKRKDFEPNDRSVVCSLHFKSEDFDKTGQTTRLREGVTPSFPYRLRKVPRSSRSHKAAAESPDVYVQLIEGLQMSPAVSATYDGKLVPKSARANEIQAHGFRRAPPKRTWRKVETILPLVDHDYDQRSLPLEEQLQEALKTITCQEDELVKLRMNRFLLKRFQCDDRLITFYTGFKDYITLMAVFMALQPTAENMEGWSQKQADQHTMTNGFKEQSLPLIDQFFLFLCHLRQGFLVQDLAIRFNVSQATVSRICTTWTNFLYYMLGSVLVWPLRETVNKCMPLSLKNTFPRTRVILDCTEIHVKRASSTALDSETYFHCKGTTTLKSLVGISPSGELTFVSDLYTGSISDREITKSSGILSLLEERDEVMAHKGFLIGDLLSAIKVRLVIPPSLGSDRHLTQEQVLQTQEIARLRIHVEQAISRIKEYHIFDRTSSIGTMGSINQVWKVCALLTTFLGPLF